MLIIETINVIGIDCATDVKKTGLSLGLYHDNKLVLKETRLGSKNISIAQTISNWINPREKVLLAIDAPLGWPFHMGHVLYKHHAGRPINVASNDLFRRATDKFIKENIGKQPLDVGAGLIARTAHTAVNIIGELEVFVKKPIKLAWDNLNLQCISAIEVYPAATLQCYNIKNTGYKGKNQMEARKEIMDSLMGFMTIKDDIDMLLKNADALDSLVCLLAAKDFIEGNVYYPEDPNTARKEGWIWVRKRDGENV